MTHHRQARTVAFDTATLPVATNTPLSGFASDVQFLCSGSRRRHRDQHSRLGARLLKETPVDRGDPARRTADAAVNRATNRPPA